MSSERPSRRRYVAYATLGYSVVVIASLITLYGIIPAFDRMRARRRLQDKRNRFVSIYTRLVYLEHNNTLYIPSCTHIILHDIPIPISISFKASNSPYKGFIHVPFQGRFCSWFRALKENIGVQLRACVYNRSCWDEYMGRTCSCVRRREWIVLLGNLLLGHLILLHLVVTCHHWSSFHSTNCVIQELLYLSICWKCGCIEHFSMFRDMFCWQDWIF